MKADQVQFCCKPGIILQGLKFLAGLPIHITRYLGSEIYSMLCQKLLDAFVMAGVHRAALVQAQLQQHSIIAHARVANTGVIASVGRGSPVAYLHADMAVHMHQACSSLMIMIQ